MNHNSVDWLYRLDQNYSWASGHPFHEDRAFRDSRGTLRLLLEKGGRITVFRNYTWNGCSPKFLVFDLLLGTPEGVTHSETGKSKTYHASMIHDALYQFLDQDLPLSRRQADAIFLRMLQEADFAPAKLYWLAVRCFGWLVRRATRAKREWNGESQSISKLAAEAGAAPAAAHG